MRTDRGAAEVRRTPTVGRFAADVVQPNEVRLGRLATVIVGDPTTAQDVVADVFLAVWPRWRDGRIDDLEAYLYRCTVNRARRYLRRRWLVTSDVPDAMDAVDNESRSLDQQLCLAAIAKLSMMDRTIVTLKYLEDRSDSAIAELLGVPIGTVKSRHSRAMTKLRAVMSEDQR